MRRKKIERKINFSVSLLESEREALQRLADKADCKPGELLRQLITDASRGAAIGVGERRMLRAGREVRRDQAI